MFQRLEDGELLGQGIETARESIRSQQLKNQREWYQYCKSGKKPEDIPTHPDRTYKNRGWTRWRDWFGSNPNLTD